MYCIQCGKALNQQDVFCTYCGKIADVSSLLLRAEDVKYQECVKKPICARCKAEIPMRAAFCPKCGEKHESDAERVPLCVACGKPLSPGSVFCIYCGMKYADDPNGAMEILQPRCCPACGEEADADSAFCISCGSPIAADTAPTKKRITPVCADCGAVYKRDAYFCDACGRAFAATNSKWVVPHYEGAFLVCPKCGEGKQPANRKCCWSCGAEFIKR